MAHMSSETKHEWIFRARFRRHSFGWRSQPAIKRIREAVAEIKKVARKDPALGGEGAVLFLEKVSPALEHVDSSSGAIGAAVNKAIEALVPIIAKAPADDTLRGKWLTRLWAAVEEDDIPYIEMLPQHWGRMCVTAEHASRWADEFVDTVRMIRDPGSERHGYYKGTSACLSALFTAGRYPEIMELLDGESFTFWSDRQWGVQSLLALGKKAEALQYAEDSRSPYASDIEISEVCERLLLSSGMADEAYTRYAIGANQKTTYLATFRAIAKKYPNKEPGDILTDLAASTPGSEGKWFAAAKSVGLYDEAIELVSRSPCDPKTLIRAARDTAEARPRFALEAGMAALRWLVEGYGYEITNLDVRAAYQHTLTASERAGCKSETVERICALVDREVRGEQSVTEILAHLLGLP